MPREIIENDENWNHRPVELILLELEKLLVARVAGQLSSTYLKKFDNSEGNVVDHLIQRGSLRGCLLMESNKQVGSIPCRMTILMRGFGTGF